MGVHVSLVGALIGLPLVLSATPPLARPMVEISLLPDVAAPRPEPEPTEPDRELIEESEPVHPEILPEPMPQQELDPREMEPPPPEFDELPLVDATEHLPHQAFRKPEPPAPEPEPTPPPVEQAPAPAPEPIAIELEPSPLPGSCPDPAYPARAQQRGWEGIVVCLVTVGRHGRVTSVEIEETSGYRTLDREVVATLERWRFEPGTRAGLPTEMQVRRRFEFRLTAP